MSRQSHSDFYRAPTEEMSAIDPADGGTIESLFKKTIREREEELMLAILEDAINSFQKYLITGSDREKKDFDEVQRWIRGKNKEWLFSFDNICETLGLDPSYLRRGLMAWAKRKGHPIELRPQ
jgi:hypothetical protein